MSLDRGVSYTAVGRVIRPASTVVVSFPAAKYVPDSTVAATAIHGIRIKVGETKSGQSREPLSLSLVPKEFSRTPKGYGGHIAGSSGIYTDIPSGSAIFRAFAPFAGSRVYLQQPGGQLFSLSPNYKPSAGDALVVVVERPVKWPAWIEFENRTGGAVAAVYPNGSRERITEVLSPVSGVGRYDGTSYTGVGAINTNHGGVLTISTAPISTSPLLEGDGPERRGGFMIQPSFHAGTQGPRVNQVMVVGQENPAKPLLEGKPPLFSGYFGLAFTPSDPENSYRTQIKIDGDEWEDLPAITGKVDNAFSPAYLMSKFGKKRAITTGVTHIRVLFPRFDREFLKAQLQKSKRDDLISAASAPAQTVSGILTIRAEVKNNAPLNYVEVCIDGQVVALTNSIPYSYDWDTTTVNNGEHIIEARGADQFGNIVTRKSTRVIVKNGSKSSGKNADGKGSRGIVEG
ncbi:MAG: Ig-like domain-containing protein [Armatimonadota bacterium]|nr:Ig-like domain-containing protein [Armatimonadota bacterium]